MNAYDVLQERGFLDQVTDAEAVRSVLQEPTTCYVGFDPTAPSFHVGSLIPIMSLAHMQRCGHRPIALLGGGTAMVGDPSGKTEMRQMLSRQKIEANAVSLKKQLGRFLDFTQGRALLLNNADWLLPLNYIEFLRDIGRHFSVNRMLSAESYKLRLETGLSFIEFNYMLLQAYDFLHLFDAYNCRIQMGGSDQWGNIVAGVDLIRRLRQKTAFGITFPLITTAGNEKMGKTATGAVWLAAELTTPYEYYQYWVNTADQDVVRFLAYFTFLPMEEIRSVGSLAGADLNMAKTVLAYEVTKITHGRQAALQAQAESEAHFGKRQIPEDFLPSSDVGRGERLTAAAISAGSIPTTIVAESRLQEGVPAFELFAEVGLCSSRAAARRLIQQGGAYVNGKRLQRFDELIEWSQLQDGEIVLRAGKKHYHKIRIDT
ncbi:MAG: tyrosine--tRNA ligase [Deltaproteobacteria bacterium]|nr:tyrosine--tRNA ligase [Deltaproteobacteria bacterium]MBW2071722.1 tyrosine--tRNA ligase [Deltaproteobacteria bacterium]